MWNAFSVEPVLWVQSWATPALTYAMNGVSLFGYTPVAVAFTVLLAFGYRLRLGAALLLLVALNAILVDAMKEIASAPRPDVVDARVQVLVPSGPMGRWDGGGQSEDVTDTYGFPSGHVATTTAFLVGGALLFRWRQAWIAALFIVPLMALSRMYLGRHFAGDVLGGVAVGMLATTLAVHGWKLRDIEDAIRGWRVARRAFYCAALLAPLALGLGIPAPDDAGRLLGLSIGALLVARSGTGLDNAPMGVRGRRIALAAVLYGVAWWTMQSIAGLFVERWAAAALLAATVPAAVLLPGPIYLERLVRASE